MKKRPPTANELATLYHAVKNQDTEEQLYRMLRIPKKLIKHWKNKAKILKRKKRRGEELTSDEKKYLRVDKLIRVAKRRRKGWS